MRTGRLFLAVGVILLGSALAQAASNEAIKRNNFGADLAKQGRLDEAITEFQSAILADPRYAAAHLNLAYAYDRSKRADEAIAAYRKALDLDPKVPAAYNNLGVLYTNQGRYDEAIQTLEQGLKLEPTNSTLQKNLETAKANQKGVQDREARIADAKKQVDARPKDPQAAHQMARVYASLYMRDEAFEWLGKAVELGFRDTRFLREDPALADLREDPRFARLVQPR
jgi:superkiller protein 3